MIISPSRNRVLKIFAITLDASTAGLHFVTGSPELNETLVIDTLRWEMSSCCFLAAFSTPFFNGALLYSDRKHYSYDIMLRSGIYHLLGNFPHCGLDILPETMTFVSLHGVLFPKFRGKFKSVAATAWSNLQHQGTHRDSSWQCMWRGVENLARRTRERSYEPKCAGVQHLCFCGQPFRRSAEGNIGKGNYATWNCDVWRHRYTVLLTWCAVILSWRQRSNDIVWNLSQHALNML